MKYMYGGSAINVSWEQVGGSDCFWPKGDQKVWHFSDLLAS